MGNLARLLGLEPKIKPKHVLRISPEHPPVAKQAKQLPADCERGKRFKGQRAKGLAGIQDWLKIQQEMKVQLEKAANDNKLHRDGCKTQTSYWSGKIRGFDSAFESGIAYMSFLSKHGFKQIGSGAYSTVYEHPKWGNKLIKVNRSLDPWLEWVMWAKESGYERFAPKVYSFRRYIEGTGKTKKSFYVAVVERLKTNCTDDNTNQHFLTGDLFCALARSENPYAKLYADLIAPGLSDFCVAFHERFKGYGKDYWGNNNMISWDGTRFILNDPIHHNGKDKKACNGNVPIRYRETRMAA